ncbi:MAG: hypothetical protein KAY24_03930 [Candidatus Eisenbacteria sp.]|nr:hypothetical protein [Candidatus Eisenbacteria bacterium]
METKTIVALIGASAAVVVAVLRFIQWLLDPQRRRKVEVTKLAKEAAKKYAVNQKITGDVQQQFIFNLTIQAPAANSEYITTGEGQPRIPKPDLFWDRDNNKPFWGRGQDLFWDRSQGDARSTEIVQAGEKFSINLPVNTDTTDDNDPKYHKT